MIETGIYRIGRGQLYYVVVNGDHIRWLGEISTGDACWLFEGKLISSDTFQGSYHMLPKGTNRTMGQETYRVINDTRFENVRSTGYYYDKIDEWPADNEVCISLLHKNGFDNNINSLTGTWLSDDGGVCYLRELDDGKVLWAAEPESRDMSGPLPWSTIFIGEIRPFTSNQSSGRVILGNYFFTPKGSIRGSGNLKLRINPENTELIKVSGGGNARKWRKIYSTVIKMECESLKVLDTNENKGDEACISMAFFRADSGAIDWDNPASAEVDVTAHFTGALAKNQKASHLPVQPSDHQSLVYHHVITHPKNSTENEPVKLGFVFSVIDDDTTGSLVKGSRIPWRRLAGVRWGRRLTDLQTLPASKFYKPGKIQDEFIQRQDTLTTVGAIETRRVEKRDYISMGVWLAKQLETAIQSEKDIPTLFYVVQAYNRDDYIGSGGHLWEIGADSLAPVTETEQLQSIEIAGSDARYLVNFRLSYLNDRALPAAPEPPQSGGGLAGGGG